MNDDDDDDKAGLVLDNPLLTTPELLSIAMQVRTYRIYSSPYSPVIHMCWRVHIKTQTIHGFIQVPLLFTVTKP